ncbi:glycosyltransferase family 4 protein [Paenibacillus doosanensis]|uniref:D-inositol-3-phosphate glycosyltransferase n=1 Tax=Paenibacillus konkukensis TaxID=2020716 RepID=A0ABY4RVH2_9BACL|nr:MULTISPECIES: glycosyltransferase family 4 protein [Paenibacillus]MCS7458823.1 glycosyltransferase family 4 protein [Paenibacillus doosanensis]UQZ86649.1 D-inositol-3-phosphate glycosyltransferase [Paenibacillus konkukensis]
MRFAFAIMTLTKGGAQRMLVEIMQGLIRKGHEVTVVMPSAGIIDFALNARLIRTAGDTMTEHDFPYADVLVSNFYTTVEAVQRASEQGKGIHMRLSLCYEPLFLPDQAVSFPTYQMTPNLLVLSRYQQELVYLNHGVEAKVIPIGVSKIFRPYSIRDHGGPLQIGAVIRKPDGGDAWHRQQEALISHMLFVKAQRPQVELNLIGPPRDVFTSPALMKLRETGQFRFYTPASDAELCYHYNQMHIFVTSSVHEACPLPALEAMKCGTPLAAVYSGGNMEYCRHEHNCLLSYATDNRLGEDIIRLVDDSGLRRRLASNGLKEAEKWTWERSVELFERAAFEYMCRR